MSPRQRSDEVGYGVRAICLSRGAVALAAAGMWVMFGCSSTGEAERASQERAKRVDQRAGSAADAASREESPDRVIVMVGDGMGAAAIRGAQYVADEPLEMLSMERLSFLTTHSYEYVTTDSAASATAVATGAKTHYEGVSVEPGTSKQEETEESRHLETTLEVAEQRDWKTGLVAMSRIVHATPAAFAAHRANRNSYEGIARDMVGSGVDLLLGGGRKFFTEREDGVNLVERMRGDGYTVVSTPEQFEQAVGEAGRLAGLFYRSDPPPLAADEPRKLGLESMMDGALEVLGGEGDAGFFLMVEGSQIDWRGHDLAGEGTVRETLRFDRAIGRALEYTRSRDDTLLVVVSDHETGGLSMLDEQAVAPYEKALGGRGEADEMVDFPGGADEPIEPPEARPRLEPGGGDSEGRMVPVFGHLSMASRGRADNPEAFWSIHTPEMVPMFAEGAGAEHLAEVTDNAELGRRLQELVDDDAEFEAEPARSDASKERPKNAVVFIGDAVGFDALTATHYVDGALGMREMPVRGLARVRGPERPVPSEREAASALLAGSPSPGEDRLESVLERAERRGYRTGVVTTGSLTNPTLRPLFAANAGGSQSAEGAAERFVGLADRIDAADGIDLAYGGGAEAFSRALREKLVEQGTKVYTQWGETGESSNRAVRFLADGSMAPASERDGTRKPTLREMTRRAFEELSSREEPFLLVVEADGPERLQASLTRSRTLVDEVAEFDRAVVAGVEAARREGETLVVATADADKTLSVFDNHYGFADGVCGIAERCGGPWGLDELPVAVDKLPDAEGLGDAELQGEYAPPRVFLEYAWPIQAASRRGNSTGDGAVTSVGTNSATSVPVFAVGPWSHHLESGITQEKIGGLLNRWVEGASTP